MSSSSFMLTATKGLQFLLQKALYDMSRVFLAESTIFLGDDVKKLWMDLKDP